MKQMTLRLSDDLHARLKDMAAKDKRSIQQEVVWLIEQEVARAGGGSGISSPT